jgi:hypothetical protein
MLGLPQGKTGFTGGDDDAIGRIHGGQPEKGDLTGLIATRKGARILAFARD